MQHSKHRSTDKAFPSEPHTQIYIYIYTYIYIYIIGMQGNSELTYTSNTRSVNGFRLTVQLVCKPGRNRHSMNAIPTEELAITSHAKLVDCYPI